MSITSSVIRSKMECSADNALGIKITAILDETVNIYVCCKACHRSATIM